MADKDTIQDPSRAVPLASEAHPQLTAAIAQILNNVISLPQRAMESSEQLRTQGQYNPAPVLEALSYVMGSSMPFAQKAALGALGGKGIKAYHGSPYDFEKFDLSKIGAGEGAQAYGHGLYFAGNPAVAQDYRKTLANKFTEINRGQIANEAAGDLGENNKYLPYAVLKQLEAGTPIDNVWSNLAKDPLTRGRTPEERNAAIDWVKKNYPDHVATAGKMYEVNINADPEHFLDWDRPLSEQHPKVQSAIAGLNISDKLGGGILGTPNHMMAPGQEIYQSLAHANQAAASSPGVVKPIIASKQDVTEQLRQAGIPGIKYLDQGSREPSQFRIQSDLQRGGSEGVYEVVGPGNISYGKFADYEKAKDFLNQKENEGKTHNYVVFDDKMIDIIKKYGIGALIAGLGSQVQKK